LLTCLGVPCGRFAVECGPCTFIPDFGSAALVAHPRRWRHRRGRAGGHRCPGRRDGRAAAAPGRTAGTLRTRGSYGSPCGVWVHEQADGWY